MRGSRAAGGAGGAAELPLGRVAQPQRRGQRRGGQPARHHEQRHVHRGGGGQRRQRERRGGGAQRHGRLAQPEGKAALGPREPAEHRPPAAARRGRGQRAGHEHARQQSAVAAGQRHQHERHGGQQRSEREHQALAEPVGQHAPGVDARDRAQPEGREHGGDLHERDVVARAQRRTERRQPALSGRQRRGRRRTESQHGPAVAGRAGSGGRSGTPSNIRRATSCAYLRPLNTDTSPWLARHLVSLRRAGCAAGRCRRS